MNGGKKMKHGGKIKIFGAGVFFFLLVATTGSIGATLQRNTPQPLGTLEFDPQSHDFGNMTEGETNSTVFEIWTSGGCCELTFNLTWNCTWITVFPTSGVSNGEHVPITVTINTTGLSNEMYTCDIFITTNGGGDGAFHVTVNIVPHTYPSLAYSPQTYYFGLIPENLTDSTIFDVWNSGTGTLDYTFSWNETWVGVSPISGTSNGEHDEITVTIDTTGMTPGETYQCSINIQSNGGNKIFFIWFIIGTTPNIEIKTVAGGLFRIQTVLINTGTANAMAIDWKITVGGNGLVLLGKETKGRLAALAIGEERTITSGLILGLGTVVVTVTAQNSEAIPVVKKASAQLVVFYIKM
jgi:Viral BACON domain